MEPELSPEQSDRLAEALIGEVVQEQLDEQRAEVIRCRERLRAAELALGRIRSARADWIRQSEVDYSLGERVVLRARLADVTPSTAPPGTHVRAVRAYFERHPPKLALERLAPPVSRLSKLGRLARRR